MKTIFNENVFVFLVLRSSFFFFYSHAQIQATSLRGHAVMSSGDPPEDRRASWPPPSTSRYLSKTCLGAMFHAKSFEDAGAPPICVGFSYRSTTPMPPTDKASAHGSFKFTCVGYGQRAIETRGGVSGAPGKGSQRRLPYCEGLQILVADATHGGTPSHRPNSHPNVMDPVAAKTLVRDLETLRRQRDDAVIALREATVTRPDDSATLEMLERFARERETALRRRVVQDAVEAQQRGEARGFGDFPRSATEKETRDPSTASERKETNPPSGNRTSAERLRGNPQTSVAAPGTVRRLIEGDKGPGVFFPSAEFEHKFVKSAGAIWKNMKKHVGYIGSVLAAGPGGMR
jgi:hypothetical protein